MNKIALEVAEQEFDRFTDFMDLDVDETTMDKEDLKGFKETKSKVIGALMRGSLIINDESLPVFTPIRSTDTNPITFYEPTGSSLMAMDQKKKDEDVGKLYAAMADITTQPPKVFSKMKYADVKVCTAIVTLFLA